MSELASQVIVGLVVLASVIYAFMRLAPQALRLRALGSIATLASWLVARSVPGASLLSDHIHDQIKKLEKATGCGSCGSCPPPKTQGEQRIDVTSIGRRR